MFKKKKMEEKSWRHTELLLFCVIHQRCGREGDKKDEKKEETEGGAGRRDERVLGVVTARCGEALSSACQCSSVLVHVDWVYQQLDGCEN